MEFVKHVMFLVTDVLKDVTNALTVPQDILNMDQNALRTAQKLNIWMFPF
jgi:hypothetical protein